MREKEDEYKYIQTNIASVYLFSEIRRSRNPFKLRKMMSFLLGIKKRQCKKHFCLLHCFFAFAAQTKAVVTKEADAHTPSEWIVDKKATTVEAGSRHQECTECGTVLKTETIAKLTDSKANINPSGKNDADKNAGEKSASSVPGTGDTSLVDVWALLMAFAVLGGVYALCRQRKAR